MYVGSKTGRDGIHGATMASESFSEEKEQRRPTVQVGDPFTEKLLLEACLELMEHDYLIGIQDMGAAGLTSSSTEMAGRGGAGIELDLSAVPLREEGMTPYEILLSESQERMLLVAKAGTEAEIKRIFDKWDLEAVVVGQVTNDNRISGSVQRRRSRVHPDQRLNQRGPGLSPARRAAQESRRPRATGFVGNRRAERSRSDVEADAGCAQYCF